MGGHVNDVTIKSIIAAMSDSPEDKQKYDLIIAELQNEKSKFCTQLQQKPFHDSSDADGVVKFQMIALWAMLHCTGTVKTKTKIFYHILQDGSSGQT